MTNRMEGKVAIVTGAGSGICKASAIAFACEGAKVVIADLATEGGQETVRTIREAVGEAVFAKADVCFIGDDRRRTPFRIRRPGRQFSLWLADVG